jgi:hypothetical protein
VILAEVNPLVQESGGPILALLERLCRDGAPRTEESVGKVVSRLVHLRDQLIAAQRAGTACRDELRRTNAIISSLFGIEFRIDGWQWARAVEARDAFKDMLRGQQ